MQEEHQFEYFGHPFCYVVNRDSWLFEYYEENEDEQNEMIVYTELISKIMNWLSGITTENTWCVIDLSNLNFDIKEMSPEIRKQCRCDSMLYHIRSCPDGFILRKMDELSTNLNIKFIVKHHTSSKEEQYLLATQLLKYNFVVYIEIFGVSMNSYIDMLKISYSPSEIISALSKLIFISEYNVKDSSGYCNKNIDEMLAKLNESQQTVVRNTHNTFYSMYLDKLQDKLILKQLLSSHGVEHTKELYDALIKWKKNY